MYSIGWFAVLEAGGKTGGLTAAKLEALLELRVLRIDCSSCMRWTRESPRGVRPEEEAPGLEYGEA